MTDDHEKMLTREEVRSARLNGCVDGIAYNVLWGRLCDMALRSLTSDRVRVLEEAAKALAPVFEDGNPDREVWNSALLWCQKRIRALATKEQTATVGAEQINDGSQRECQSGAEEATNVSRRRGGRTLTRSHGGISVPGER